MINATELRLNNLLHTYDGRVVRVTIAVLSEIESGIVLTSHPVREPYKPICLTPEVLEKAGFILTGQSHWRSADGSIERLDLTYAQYDGFARDDQPNMHIDCILDPETRIVRRIGVGNFSCPGLSGRVGTPIDLKYVHHLQNVYRALTGEELNIDL